MTKEEIYNALNPAWWISQQSAWGTEFMSTEINFENEGGIACSYVSSAPFQTNGLNAGTGAYTNDLTDFVNGLRTEASQRLFDMHCSAIISNDNLKAVFNATE